MNKGKKHRPNLSEIAYQEIKEMILAGELAQGERLLLDDLSERLNLSITPIREALNILAQDDLIDIRPRTSHQVVSLDADDSSDILELRILMETFAMETWGDNVSRFPVKRFRKIFQDPRLANNHKRFASYDAEFHGTIIAGSVNKRLPKLYGYIQNLVRMEFAAAARVEGRIEVAVREHLDILDAIEAGDLSLATQRLRSHLKKVKTVLLTA